MTAFELASVLMAFVALVISILAFAQQAISSALSMSMSQSANEISKKALDISQSALEISKDKHRIDTIPNLTVSNICMVFDADDPEADIIEIIIQNIGYSEVSIDRVDVRGYFEIAPRSLPRIPTKLGFNNDIILGLKFRQEKVRANLLRKVRADSELGSGESLLSIAIKELLDKMYVAIDLTQTQLNIRYQAVQYGMGKDGKFAFEQERRTT